MTECEKIASYVQSANAPKLGRRDMTVRELLALHKLGGVEALRLAFRYGVARGYERGKQEVRNGRKK